MINSDIKNISTKYRKYQGIIYVIQRFNQSGHIKIIILQL